MKIHMDLSELDRPVKLQDFKICVYYIFSIIIFLLPIIPEVNMAFSLSFKCVLFNVTTCITLLILGIIQLKEKKFHINIYDKLFIGYILIVILSTLFTKYSIYKSIFGYAGRGEGLLTIISYVSTAIIFSKGYRYIKKLLIVAVIGATIVSIYGIIQANVSLGVKLPFNTTEVQNIAEGTMGNQNFLSSYICLFLPSLCFMFLNSKNKYILIVIAIVTGALIYAKSSSGYLVCSFLITVICIISIMFFKEKKKTILKVLTLLIVIVSVYILISLINGNQYVEEFKQSETELASVIQNDESLGNGRLAIWKRTIIVIKNNMFLGVGPDNLKLELSNKKYFIDGDNDYLSKIIVDKAHSEYLQIAATTGIISLAIYMCIVCAVLFNLLKINIQNLKNKNNDMLIEMSILIGLLAYLAQALVNISVVQVAPVYFAMLGIGIGIIENKKENEE